MINFKNVDTILSLVQPYRLLDSDINQLKKDWDKIESKLIVSPSDKEIELFISIVYLIGESKFTSFISKINNWHITIFVDDLHKIFIKTGIFYNAYKKLLKHFDDFSPSVELKAPYDSEYWKKEYIYMSELHNKELREKLELHEELEKLRLENTKKVKEPQCADAGFIAMNYWWKVAKAYETVLEEIAESTITGIRDPREGEPTYESQLAEEILKVHQPRRK